VPAKQLPTIQGGGPPCPPPTSQGSPNGATASALHPGEGSPLLRFPFHQGKGLGVRFLARRIARADHSSVRSTRVVLPPSLIPLPSSFGAMMNIRDESTCLVVKYARTVFARASARCAKS
jgi:hypothetical protein